jgi:glycosyltransferase involved in cell wall biosynthesis
LGRVIYSGEARRKFGRLLDRFQPDIVHLQNIHAHITPSIIFEADQRRIPIVWTIHDYKLVCPNSHFLIDQTGEICEACRGGRFWRAAQKRCKKNSLLASAMASMEAYAHQWIGIREKVNLFFSPSAFLRTKLLECGFDACKVIHLPLFLPEDAFSRSKEDNGYILFIGKLEPLKGIHMLIAAARMAPEVQVVLAGRAEEPLLSQLPSLLPPNAKYVGFMAGQELSSLKHHARAVIVPSLWYENQPFSILEAFAFGKPVITTNLGGMRELIGENERGRLIPLGNPESLALTMNWMVKHPLDARQLGEAAFQYAKEQHYSQGHYQRLQAIYQDTLK